MAALNMTATSSASSGAVRFPVEYGRSGYNNKPDDDDDDKSRASFSGAPRFPVAYGRSGYNK